MDEQRKTAYRYLFYVMTGHIRDVCGPAGFPVTFLSELNTVDADPAREMAREAYWIAYVLHNFALAVARDFVDFDEEAFWKGLDTAHEAFGVDFQGYRISFEAVLADNRKI